MSESNGGITWFGSDFTGPGNKVADNNNKFNAVHLPQTIQDWVTLEHDVEYHNLSAQPEIDIDEVRKSDFKAIANSNNRWTNDKYFGDLATQVGLILKRTFEDSIHTNLYPQPVEGAKEITWFSKPLSRKKGTFKYATQVARSSST